MRLSLYEYVGIGLILLGGTVAVFLKLRPNRIEEGISMNMLTAVGELWLPTAAVVIGLILLAALDPSRTKDEHRLTQGIRLVKVIGLATGLVCLIQFSASGATDLLMDQPSAARVSLGIGFWLVFLGMAMMLMHSLKLLSMPLLTLGILGVIIGYVIIAYHMGLLDDLSIVREYTNKSGRIGDEMLRHMQLSLAASFTGLFLSLFLAGQAYRYPSRRGMVMSFVNMAQVIPTLTFLGLIMIPLTALAGAFPFLKNFGISGIGFIPAYIVLTMYAILPMTTNILAGYNSIDPDILQAAYGMGMTQKQVHRKVELPLVFPFLFSGFSTALVQTVGNTILAGLVGGGGIGAILFLGLAQSAPDFVILGALLVVSVALVLKLILANLQLLIKRLNPVEVQHD